MQTDLNEIYISFCIPTDGIAEWFFPVVNSIYSDNADETLFEVVVTDNGENEEFHKQMMAYCRTHHNLVYKKTSAPLFLNEIEAYKLAKGSFIKFINHRTILLPGAAAAFLKFVLSHLDSKPIIYFANGELLGDRVQCEYQNFDEFVGGLSYWSTWSTGMGFWKEDFDKIPEDTIYNYLFPHTTILFHERQRRKYIIDNQVYLKEIDVGHAAKGKYDLYYAFAVEFPGILCELLRDGSITLKTFVSVKQELLKFIMSCYYQFNIRKEDCSYIISSFDKVIGVFYNKNEAKRTLGDMYFQEERNKLAFSLKKWKHDDKLIIFGAGAIGRVVYEYCEFYGLQVLAFTDNDSQKWKTALFDKKIISPKEAVDEFPDAVYVIANLKSSEEIYTQLIRMGISSENIQY